jgi:hypothetical protein
MILKSSQEQVERNRQRENQVVGDEELFKWEEECAGEEDMEIIVEMEIETEDDILDLCIRKNDDVSTILDDFFKQHHKRFTHAQMRELRVELRSRLGESSKQ